MKTANPVFNLTFKQMFLLVNRLNGATVLLPNANHTATISGAMLPGAITLSAADVFLRKDNQNLVDGPTLRPGARLLPYLDYVFASKVVPKAGSRTAVIPPTIGARVILAGGYLSELPASNPAVRDIDWQFIREDKTIVLTQQLTDQMLFTLPLEDGASYELVIVMDGKQQTYPIPATGAELVLFNEDNTGVGETPPDDIYVLTEYALLYGLTSADTQLTKYPYPTAAVPGLGGGPDPMCGGGQTDDEEEPPPPTPDP